MQPSQVPGTEGYSEDAESLISQYESVSFEDKYRAVFHLLPVNPSQVLDIGAGTGVDSAWLANNGHDVVAVEPVKAFREAAIELHPSPRIEWLDDSLPQLSKLELRKSAFDLILISAVWHHLNRQERTQTMLSTAALLRDGAILVMSIRRGPSPSNRRTFEVSANEVIELGRCHGLQMILEAQVSSTQPVNRKAGVSWTWLVFKK